MAKILWGMILHIVCLYGKCNHRIFLLYYFSEFFFKIDIIIGFDRFLTPPAELLSRVITEISYFCNVINRIAMRNLFLLIALCCVAFSVRAQRLVEVGKGF